MGPTRKAREILRLAMVFMLSSALPAQTQPFPCGQDGSCPRAYHCVEGSCVPRCQPPGKEPAFADFCYPDLEAIGYSQGGPGSDPGCATCSARFELASVRTMLQVAGVNQPVKLRLLDRGALPLAELGVFTPQPEEGWAKLPESVDAPLLGRLKAACGFTVEIADPEGNGSVRRSVCLVKR